MVSQFVGPVHTAIQDGERVRAFWVLSISGPGHVRQTLQVPRGGLRAHNVRKQMLAQEDTWEVPSNKLLEAIKTSHLHPGSGV